MEASYNHDLNLPFVMKADDLEKLYKFTFAATGECEVTIQCRDGVVRRTSQITEALKYENPLGQEIQSVTIAGVYGKPTASVNITLSSGFFHTVSVRIRAEEAELLQLRAEMDAILKGLRPWYAPVAKNNVFGIIPSVIFFLYIAAGLSLFVTLPDSNVFSQEEMKQFRESALLFLMIAWLTALILNKLRTRFFPEAFFAIGQGLRRHGTNEMFRWTVVIGFFVSAIAGISLKVF